jgi:uncharacterized protein YecE (DUF72 family)
VVRGWVRKTPENFPFTVKMFRGFLDPKKPGDPQKLPEYADAPR